MAGQYAEPVVQAVSFPAESRSLPEDLARWGAVPGMPVPPGQVCQCAVQFLQAGGQATEQMSELLPLVPHLVKAPDDAGNGPVERAHQGGWTGHC